MILAVPDGLEPSIATFREWCADQLRYGTIMAVPEGLEPSRQDSKSRILTIILWDNFGCDKYCPCLSGLKRTVPNFSATHPS